MPFLNYLNNNYSTSYKEKKTSNYRKSFPILEILLNRRNNEFNFKKEEKSECFVEKKEELVSDKSMDTPVECTHTSVIVTKTWIT
jgi:hypothetical protein